MPSFSKPDKVFDGHFSFASPAVPQVTPATNRSHTSQSSPPNVSNFPPSPEKLIKMDFVDNPNRITDTTLEEISKKQNEILNFLANAAHNIEREKYLDSDVCTISDNSTGTTSGRSSRRNRRSNKYKKKKKSESKSPTMNSVNEKDTGNMPSQTGFSGTPFTPTSILQPPKRLSSPTSSEAIYRNQK